MTNRVPEVTKTGVTSYYWPETAEHEKECFFCSQPILYRRKEGSSFEFDDADKVVGKTIFGQQFAAHPICLTRSRKAPSN